MKNKMAKALILVLAIAFSFTLFTACSTLGDANNGGTQNYSKGLAYAVNEDGKTCAITGIGTCKDTKVVIPETIEGYTVTSIGEFAFSSCIELESVVIPDSVISIGDYAFQLCSNLTNVTIGTGVTSIGLSAFEYCNNLKSVYITDLASWCKASQKSWGPLYYGAVLYLNNTPVTELIIPDSVTSIGNNAFRKYEHLTSVTIHGGVTSIGSCAFQDCTNLSNVNIGDGVTSIGDTAFWGCTSLTSVEIPASVTSIEGYVFYRCTNCLKYDFSTHTSVPTLGFVAFYEINANAKIIVPDALYDEWIAATNWADYASNIIKASEYTEA